MQMFNNVYAFKYFYVDNLNNLSLGFILCVNYYNKALRLR